jgi:hypothetical protein
MNRLNFVVDVEVLGFGLGLLFLVCNAGTVLTKRAKREMQMM